MDAFELLKADHKKVAELFDLLETASGKRKLDVFKQIKGELDLHAHIEEAIFYPAIEKPEPTHDLTLEAYEEHKVVKTLLKELSRAETVDDEWQAKAKVLRENVEHHVKEEENELFDKADDVLSAEEIEKLGTRMEAEKARKQGRPAPRKTAAKGTKKGAADTAEPGILSKIANFVGLGSDTAEKKSGAKKSLPKKTAAPKAAKSVKANSSKSAAKSASAAATKRPAKGKGSKWAATSRSGGSTKKKSPSGTAKKATKK
jgi:hemerythrin-like domain-containing protein